MECIDRSSRQQQSIAMPHRHINMKSRTPYRIPSAAGWCCTLILALTLSANAFNLENRLPLIKYGSAGSYFGYSVAEHVETDSEDIKWWVHFLTFIVRGGSDNVERFTLRDTSWNAWVRCRFVYLAVPYVIFAVKCRYLHCGTEMISLTRLLCAALIKQAVGCVNVCLLQNMCAYRHENVRLCRDSPSRVAGW